MTPESKLLTAKNLARQSRNQSSKPYFTAETPSSQRSEYFLIKNSLLRVLRASAVSSLLDRYNQNSRWKICASCENFQVQQYSNTAMQRTQRTFLYEIFAFFVVK
jgi:hypothetical protein